MTIVAGIDIGNHTTEIVLADLDGGSVQLLGHGHAPTRGRKGSVESLEGAATLLRKLEVEFRLSADELLLPELRPVDTATTPIAAATPSRSPLRNLLRPTASTPAGTGVGMGKHVPLADLEGSAPAGNVIVSVATGFDFESAAATISAAIEDDWQITGVLVADDDAVLIHNRIPADIPIVDEVDLSDLDAGAMVAVEVVEQGRAYRALTDPIAVAAAFGLDHTLLPMIAHFTREFSDAPALAFTQRNTTTEMPTPNLDYDYVDVRTSGGTVRYSTSEAKTVLRTTPPGAVTRVQLKSIAAAAAGLMVDDAYFTDLASLDDGSWLRRGVVETRGTVVALLATDVVSDAAETMSRLAGRPSRTIASEPEAASAGARTTPGVPPGTVVCDIGGGTIDLIASNTIVTAAGAGETITSAVASVLGISRALAERVKRTPAILIEGPHIAHEEDGRREFLASPAPPDAIGRLCTRGSAGLVPFAHAFAAEEWRSLRLAIKQQTVAANIARCFRSFPETPAALLLAGGGALDDELLRTVGESMRAAGVVVGRANVNGVHGPRFAVAAGLIQLHARTCGIANTPSLVPTSS
jgi:hypothetical protein